MSAIIYMVGVKQTDSKRSTRVMFDHHPPHLDNVTVPHGCPNLRSQLHFSYNQEGEHEVHDGHVVALDKMKICQNDINE
jgi:hypothetical protein